MRLMPAILLVLALVGCQTVPPRQDRDKLPMQTVKSSISAGQTNHDAGQMKNNEDSNSNGNNNMIAANTNIQATTDKTRTGVVYHNICKMIAAGMSLKVPVNLPRVQQQLKWFTHHPSYLKQVSKRARPYIYWVVTQLKRRHMPVELALLPIVESAYNPFAYSHGQASGIWQIIPETAAYLGLRKNWWYDGRRDVSASTKAALDYLEWLNRLFDGDWLNTLAAYNSGQGRVLDAIRDNQKNGQPTDFWALHLPQETQAYVPKLLALSELVKHPHKYHINLPSIPNQPYLKSVNIGEQIDLAGAAELAGINPKRLYKLNPGFNRWATDPQGPHQLMLPIDHVQRFKTALASLPSNKRLQWRRHRVVSGDSLIKIAKVNHTTPNILRKLNRLSNSMIKIGQYLIIPITVRTT